VTFAATRFQEYGNRREYMDDKKSCNVTRREVLVKAAMGVFGVLLLPLFPRVRRETKREKFLRNISNIEASHYKRLAG